MCLLFTGFCSFCQQSCAETGHRHYVRHIPERPFYIPLAPRTLTPLAVLAVQVQMLCFKFVQASLLPSSNLGTWSPKDSEVGPVTPEPITILC